MTAVIALTREDIAAQYHALPPHSRGRQVYERIAKRMATEELRQGVEFRRAAQRVEQAMREACDEIERFATTLNDPTLGLAH